MAVSRRHFNRTVAAATATLMLPSTSCSQPRGDGPKWLLFTKSADYEHDVIKRAGVAPSPLARNLVPLFADRGLTLVESKDGRLFDPESIKAYAGFIFFTCGDLATEGTDRQPPISTAGKKALLDAVAAGTPFIALHCAADTFHGPAGGEIDPFIAMIGCEFESHGDQQVGTARIVDKDFLGIGKQADWKINEEWYAFKYIAKDIHPIQVLNPAGLKGDMYARPEYPITWTRTHGKGRIFYTALAHREDTIASKAYRNLIGGAIDWCRNS